MSELAKIRREVSRANEEGRLISDACARMISTLRNDGPLAVSFANTGAIPLDDFMLWGEMFPNYSDMDAAGKVEANAMAWYLAAHRPRDAVPGWSDLWIED